MNNEFYAMKAAQLRKHGEVSFYGRGSAVRFCQHHARKEFVHLTVERGPAFTWIVRKATIRA